MQTSHLKDEKANTLDVQPPPPDEASSAISDQPASSESKGPPSLLSVPILPKKLVGGTFDGLHLEMLTGDLAKTAEWAFKGEEIDPLALRLLRGVCVYSLDWKADLWLVLKNKQIILSMFLCHPNHPFSRSERRFAFIVSCLLAWGLECWFCAFRYESCYEHPELNFVELFIHILLLKIVISATINGLYDATLEFAMTCPCVQTGVPHILKVCCETLSYFQLLIQFAGGLLVLVVGAYYLAYVTHDGIGDAFWTDVATSVKELFIGKAVGLGVVTLLIETIAFLFGRKAQMKPDRDELGRLAVWNSPSPGCCGAQKEPPNTMWNTFVGEEKHYVDLPRWPPTYDVKATICCWTFYEEKASEPEKIPSWFKCDLTKPATCIQKWLRSDKDPRLVGQEETWKNPTTFLPPNHPNYKASQVVPEPVSVVDIDDQDTGFEQGPVAVEGSHQESKGD